MAKKMRTKKTIRDARRILAGWLAYCHRRGSAHTQRFALDPCTARAIQERGVVDAGKPWYKYFICTGCAYDAVAEALERPLQKKR